MSPASAADELGEEDHALFRSLCDHDSAESVLYNPEYYGFYTYTMFRGAKPL